MIKPATAEQLSRRLASAQSEARLPSVAAGIIRDGQLIWSGAHGTIDGRSTGREADGHTQYRIGSITKTLVAVLIMRLRDEGALDLADTYEQHVPGTPIGDVTIAQLLSHSAGLAAETDGPWWERTSGEPWRELAGRLGFRHLPGRRFHYSNIGYAALGELVARLRGHPWSQAVSTELLEPLGMQRTTQRPVAPHAHGLAVHPFADVVLDEPEHDAGAMAPAGQLWSTAHDLARWAGVLSGHTDGLLDPGTLAEMRMPLVLDDTPGLPWTAAYGLGLQVSNFDGRRYVGHGGSMPGFLASLLIDVESGDGAVLFTNSTTGLPRALAGELLGDVAELEPRAPAPWHVTEADANLLDIVGHWYWGPAAFELHATGGSGLRLAPTSGSGLSSRFDRSGTDQWVGRDGYLAGEALRAIRRTDGTLSHLDLASFRFTRTPYDPDADVPGGVDDAGWH